MALEVAAQNSCSCTPISLRELDGVMVRGKQVVIRFFQRSAGNAKPRRQPAEFRRLFDQGDGIAALLG